MTKDDVDELRRCGFSDAQVADAVQVISYFNYINRVADGLGVDPENFMTPRPKNGEETSASSGVRRTRST